MRLSLYLRRFRDFSLGQKLMLYVVLFVVLPLVVAAAIINAVASGTLTEKTKENLFQTLKQTQFTLEDMIRESDYLSYSILSDENIQDLIHFYEKKSYLDIERSKSALQHNWGGTSIQSVMSSKPYIDSVAISRGNEIILQFGNNVQLEDTRFHNEAAALQGKVLWTPVYKLSHLYKAPYEKMVISLIRVVNSLESGKPIATGRISLDEKALSTAYSGIHTWKGGRIFIIDAKGRVLSSPDKAMLGLDLSKEPDVREALKSREGTFDVKLGGQRSEVFHYSLDATGWQVIETIPKSELTKRLGALNLFIFVCIAICLLFGIVFTFIQNRTIVRPLKSLAKEMGKVKNGIFDVRLEARGQDEIGIVSATFVSMIHQIRELIDKVYKSQIQEKEAELKSLQSQINPHFLYNTLDSIRWLAVRNRDYEVGEQLEALSDLFRHMLHRGQEVITIGEELEHLENYMSIQQKRFGDKIAFRLEVPEQIRERQTLKLLLQPLVENAIFHGLEPKMGKGTVKLSIREGDGKLFYVVEDDGVGMVLDDIKPLLDAPDDRHRGFALKNVKDRLRLQFGPEFDLHIESKPGQGTRVSFETPIYDKTDTNRAVSDTNIDEEDNL
ncbi:sensor histidine kinase [Paenibacillus sp. BC26]|uniref:sensor histidine kinase n=1 Tax=Paenibacillus sp. BC26 TaxID=1881032 RepID=UPI0008E8FDC3|nr:sensor histidine kinase [Paenibacillus sp. BC26]SFT06667.1 two-component system, sensor histidine kinase YesM [Paenibacillus sp. BC26]